MNRRSFMQASLLTGASLLLQRSAIAQLFQVAEFKIKMLRNNVGIFTERGGTIGFCISQEGIAVIDTQFADTAGHLITELKQQHNLPFHTLLNTHHHGDHTGGNTAFRGLVKQVVAHQNALGHQKRLAEAAGKINEVLLPDQTFSDKWNMKLGKEKLQAYYFGAGHTNGDAVYHFEDANIAHLGDLMFNRRHPFVDRSSGANIRSWISVLESVQKKMDKNTMYIFGHSLRPGEETGTAEDLKLFQDYLSKLLQFTEAEIKAGKSKEEFLKNKAIPGVTEWQGDGIERPLTAAYEELTAKV